MRTKQHRFDVLGGNPADALHKICSLRLRLSGWSLGKMCSQQAVSTVRCPPLVRTLCTALMLGRTHLTVFGGLCQSRPSAGIHRRQQSYFVRPLRV
jgi:hypothetical protein